MYGNQTLTEFMSIFFSQFGNDYLVLVDSHSKWLEIELMRGATSYRTIETLRKWISQFGLPTQLVSDNGPQFVSNDFKLYLEKMGLNIFAVRCIIPVQMVELSGSSKQLKKD